MSKVISPIMTDGTGMAIAQAINHATAVQLALNTASYEEDGTLLEVQDARTINETQYASLGEAIRTEVTRIDNEKEVQAEALEGHADRITAVENKANTNATNISKLNDEVKIERVNFSDVGLNNENFTTNGRQTIYKFGKLCFLHLCGSLKHQLNAGLDNGINLGTLPYSINKNHTVGNTFFYMGEHLIGMEINQNSEIIIFTPTGSNPISAGGKICIDTLYICQ